MNIQIIKSIVDSYTIEELKHFVSQVAHESDQWNAYEEYASGSGYEGRKDLGNVVRGDGIRFKGRGPIQTTGRSNYKSVGDEILKLSFLTTEQKSLFENDGILKNPELLEDPLYGTLAALIYWTKKDLNSLCLQKDKKVVINRYYTGKGWVKYSCSSIEGITRKVNGGMNGFDDRNKNYDKLTKIYG